MSSPNILSINSGPLIIRTYNNSLNDTYILGNYDYPISSNYVLITSTNGQLIPTSSPTISSITIGSTITCSQIANISSINTNYISSAIITCSTISSNTLNVSISANFNYRTFNFNLPNEFTLDSNPEYIGSYIFLFNTNNVNPYTYSISLNNPNKVNGNFINITCYENTDCILTDGIPTSYTLNSTMSALLIFTNNAWNIVSISPNR